jgi:hypothetical protein
MKAVEEDLTDDRSLRLVELMEQASEDAQGDWSQFQRLINRVSSQGLPSSAVRVAVERFQLSVALQWDLSEQEVVPLLSAVLRSGIPPMLGVRLAAELARWAARTRQSSTVGRDFYDSMTQAADTITDAAVRREALAVLAAARWPPK